MLRAKGYFADATNQFDQDALPEQTKITKQFQVSTVSGDLPEALLRWVSVAAVVVAVSATPGMPAPLQTN
jgi:hypothetical protein